MTACTSGSVACPVRLREAVAADIEPLQRFVAALSPRSRLQRFFSPIRQLPSALVQALQRGDPRHRFVVAELDNDIVALGQYSAEPHRPRCELALVVGDDWQGCGLGAHVLRRLLDIAVAAGLREAVLETMAGNAAMRRLARRFGFVLERHPEDATLVWGQRKLVPGGSGEGADARPAGAVVFEGAR